MLHVINTILSVLKSQEISLNKENISETNVSIDKNEPQYRFRRTVLKAYNKSFKWADIFEPEMIKTIESLPRSLNANLSSAIDGAKRYGDETFFSQTNFAGKAGIVRETANRNLKKLQKMGLIEMVSGKSTYETNWYRVNPGFLTTQAVKTFRHCIHALNFMILALLFCPLRAATLAEKTDVVVNVTDNIKNYIYLNYKNRFSSETKHFCLKWKYGECKDCELYEILESQQRTNELKYQEQRESSKKEYISLNKTPEQLAEEKLFDIFKDIPDLPDRSISWSRNNY